LALNRGTGTIYYFQFLHPHSSVISIFLLHPLTKQPPPPYYTFFRVICFLWLTHSPSLGYPVLKTFFHWVSSSALMGKETNSATNNINTASKPNARSTP